ncbi:MAG: response regulator [Desulfobacter sp.]|nr:MAG: response regulator [Desulfobacter sp.]
MKVSIRGVVITGVIILIWGTFLISTPLSYISNKKVMLVHTMDVMENISDLTVKQARNFFSTARGAARLTKRLISSKVVYTDREHIEKLEKYFIDQLEIYPQFAGIYFANPQGEFYFVNRSNKFSADGYRTKFIRTTDRGRETQLIWRNREMALLDKAVDADDTFDPRRRPWYKKAAKEKQVIWTEPYIFFTTKKPGITTAGPIYDNGKLVGVVGVDIELGVLSDFIGGLRVGKSGVAFMIDQENNVIAYPDMEELKYRAGNGDNIRLPKLRELSNPVCRLALDAVKAAKTAGSSIIPEKDSVYAGFTDGSEKYYTMFTPVRESKISWRIGVYIPEKDYFGKLISNHRINMLVVFILSCIATVLGLIFTRKIIRPIAELDREAQFVTHNNYTRPQKINTAFVEIQRTADTFHDMKKAVIDYKAQLKKEEEIQRAINEKLQQAQKMEALGLLAGGVAHDLNNVLSGLVSYPELLLLDLPQDSPLREPILTIKDSGKTASSIVDDLLTLTRRRVPNMKAVNLNRIIHDYLKSPEHQSLIRRNGHVIVRPNLAPDLFNINGSAVHLGKTVMNLVSNAAEAMKTGGDIAITTRNIYLDSPVNGYDSVREGDFVLLTVQDTGSGIAPEDLKRIFEPFYTTKVMGRSGTGLGMSVVWGTVQDHGGYIDVESTPGKGTRFQLYFPATRQTLRTPEPAVDIKEYTGNGERILVVDDVAEQRAIASTLLTRLNYRVSTVSGGREALDFLAREKADILLLDMVMEQGMDGLDTYRAIIERHPGQKAVVVSGFSDDERVREILRLGAGAYVKKPYTLEIVGLALKKELSGSNAVHDQFSQDG